MAKVKKMAFGGMGSRPSPVRNIPVGNYSNTMAALSKPQAAMGSVGVPDYAKAYMNQAAMQQAPLPRNGVQMPMGVGVGGSNNGTPGAIPDYLKAYTAQAGQPTGVPPASAPAFKGLGGMKKGGEVKKYAKGGSVSSASKRADGIATKGKTRGTMIMCGGGMAKGKK